MLILQRGPDESIIINNNIRVMIVANDGYNVKLGIEAPEDIPVHREEIQMLIKQKEQRQKSSLNDGYGRNNDDFGGAKTTRNKFNNRKKVHDGRSRRYYNTY